MRKIVPDEHGQQVIRRRGPENTPHHGLPPDAAGKGHGQELGFVAHFGEHDEGERGQERGHFRISLFLLLSG